MSKLFLVAILIVIIIVVAYFLWKKEYHVKFAVTSCVVDTTGVCTLTGSTKSSSSPAKWVGCPIVLYAKSYSSPVSSTVVSASATGITFQMPATVTSVYVADPADYAVISLKMS